MEIFYTSMSIFVAFPFLALFPAIIFVFVYRFWSSRTALVAAAFWGIYALYEGLIFLDIICAGDCNIRVDLLAIFPALLAFSAFAIMMIIIGRRRGGKNRKM